MKVIVDTSIWSMVFRRKQRANKELAAKLLSLIDDSRVVLLGPIRQEILSGVKSKKQFDQLKDHLSAFPDFPLTVRDYEKAAEFFNTCRSKGIQGSNTDFLICAVSFRHNFSIFTTDKDFYLFQNFLPIKIEK